MDINPDIQKYTAILTLIFCLLLSYPSEAQDLLNKKMPLLSNRTLEDRKIDYNFYKDHITIVNFMFIGCKPCMNEIAILNQLQEYYSSNPKVQFLCIASHSMSQMIGFNSELQDNLWCKIREAFGTNPIKYNIQPACLENDIKIDLTSGNISLQSQCNNILDYYGVNAYPTTFLIDGNSIIRKISIGGPVSKNDTVFFKKLKLDIQTMIKD